MPWQNACLSLDDQHLYTQLLQVAVKENCPRLLKFFLGYVNRGAFRYHSLLSTLEVAVEAGNVDVVRALFHIAQAVQSDNPTNKLDAEERSCSKEATIRRGSGTRPPSVQG
jgi:hypothetical protein